jgi:hypothetical protein
MRVNKKSTLDINQRSGVVLTSNPSRSISCLIDKKLLTSATLRMQVKVKSEGFRQNPQAHPKSPS